MKAPHFWSAGLDPKSREAAPVTRALLTPLAALYTAGIRRKLRNASPVRVTGKVICIGNLTVGGVGKTPVVDAVRAWFDGKGHHAASLSRGYGGRLKGPLKVDSATHTAAEVGDEPLMLAAQGESWIGADRIVAAQDMTKSGVEVIVMDDGHQNPSLHKDLSLIVIDSAAPFGNGHVLPKGPLREPIADGLARADGVILMGDGGCPSEVSASGLSVVRARLVPTSQLPEGPLVAFAGIGRPLKFFDTLKAAGADLREGVSFDDHYAYKPGDFTYLKKLAADHGARLITTTKDHVRLPVDMRGEVLSFPVHAQFDDMAALDAMLASLFNS